MFFLIIKYNILDIMYKTYANDKHIFVDIYF